MGAGASVTTSMKAEIDRLRERELNTKEENVKEWDKEEVRVSATLVQLQSERNELAQRLAQAEMCLEHQRDGWRKEKDKTVALIYSGLPLSLLTDEDVKLLEKKSALSITKSFPMVTIAQSDVVGFSILVTSLKPQEVIRIIDHLHALTGEAYSSEEIFVMERSSDNCTAVAGLTDNLLEEKSLKDDSLSSLSLADSSYGSQNYLLDVGTETYSHTRHLKDKQKHNDGCQKSSKQTTLRTPKTAYYYASRLATAVLNLLSASSKVNIPMEGRKQLQLRVALHSGPCLAGVQGLQTVLGSNRIPHFKLMGPTVRHVSSLCRSGLALQIRVSKDCKDLLSRDEEFLFERCPDYVVWANRKPIESYWLVGKRNLPLKLPSLDLAISLSDYEDM